MVPAALFFYTMYNICIFDIKSPCGVARIVRDRSRDFFLRYPGFLGTVLLLICQLLLLNNASNKAR